MKAPIVEVKDTAQKSVESCGKAQRLCATQRRGASPSGPTPRGACSPGATPRRAPKSIKKGCGVTIDDLEKRLEMRIKDVTSGRVEHDAADAGSEAAAEHPEGKRLEVQGEVDALRVRMARPPR